MLAGPDSGSQASVRPVVPATRATPQRAAAAESAQSSQAKAALKQVHLTGCDVQHWENKELLSYIPVLLPVCLCFQLNDAFTLYKKEKAENDKMVNETNDMLQKQLTELRSSHAKLTSQLEFSSKRFVRSDEPRSDAPFVLNSAQPSPA